MPGLNWVLIQCAIFRSAGTVTSTETATGLLHRLPRQLGWIGIRVYHGARDEVTVSSCVGKELPRGRGDRQTR